MWEEPLQFDECGEESEGPRRGARGEELIQIYRRDITVAAINVMNRLDMGRPAAVAGGGHGHGSGCCLLFASSF